MIPVCNQPQDRFSGLYKTKIKDENGKEIRIYQYDVINIASFALLNCVLKKINDSNNNQFKNNNHYHDIQHNREEENKMKAHENKNFTWNEIKKNKK